MTWNVIYFGMFTLRKLPQPKMLGELHLIITCYFCHFMFNLSLGFAAWLAKNT